MGRNVPLRSRAATGGGNQLTEEVGNSMDVNVDSGVVGGLAGDGAVELGKSLNRLEGSRGERKLDEVDAIWVLRLEPIQSDHYMYHV